MCQVYGSLLASGFLSLEIEILDSLWIQCNGSEVIAISNFSNVMLRFAIVFEFCYFPSLTIFTGQQNISCRLFALMNSKREKKWF